MRNSQYLKHYLDSNASRGDGKGLTIQSYLQYRLGGKAKKYSLGYVIALQNSVDREVYAGRAEVGKSFGGRLAYYPVN
jgi:hypothetical protein